jgi:hypothetical protein
VPTFEPLGRPSVEVGPKVPLHHRHGGVAAGAPFGRQGPWTRPARRHRRGTPAGWHTPRSSSRTCVAPRAVTSERASSWRAPRARGRGGGARLGLEREGALLGDGLVVDGAELEQAGCAGAVEDGAVGVDARGEAECDVAAPRSAGSDRRTEAEGEGEGVAGEGGRTAE